MLSAQSESATGYHAAVPTKDLAREERFSQQFRNFARCANFAYEADSIVVVHLRCCAERTRRDRKIGRWRMTYNVRSPRLIDCTSRRTVLVAAPEICSALKIGGLTGAMDQFAFEMEP